MALEISRETFERMSQEERHQVITEGAVIVDPEQREAEARREYIRATLAAERRARTIKREAFDKLPEPEKWAYIRNGGLLED